MKYFATKISDNLQKTPEGYLLCLGVPIGRTGTMDYAPGEVPLEPGEDGIIKVTRSAEELFTPETIASFNGKPFTIRHPEEWVGPENWSRLAKGTIQNVRRGSGDLSEDLLADILITDAFTISLVESGVRGLSCGYEAGYKKTGLGIGIQQNIVGNHLALVEEGRAGEAYKINDSKGVFGMSKEFLKHLKDGLTKLTKTVDEAAEPVKVEAKDEDAMMMDELKKCFQDLGSKIDAMGKKSEDVAKPEEKKDVPAQDADPMEERLKALEMAVAKLLEGQSSVADEDKDEEVKDEDEVTDEESDEETADEDKYAAVGDEASRVEILAPGLKAKTKDAKELKTLALKKAYQTKDGKKVIDALTGGKPDFKADASINMLFIAAAEMLADEREGQLLQVKKQKTSDSAIKGAITPEQLNEINKKYYNK